MAAKKTKSKKIKQMPAEQVQQVSVPEVSVGKEMDSPRKESEHKVRLEPMTKKDTIMVVLYSVLLFVGMTVQTGRMSLILPVLAIVSMIGKKPVENLRAHLSVPMLGLVAFAVMCGFASLYSRFGSNAAAELNKVMASFSLAVILLARFERKHVRGLLWGFATVCAVIALVCVDMGSWGKLFELFNGYVQALGGDFSSTLENSLGNRVNGIYNDGNLTGALLGLAILISAYLAHTAEKLSGRFAALMLMGVSVVSFLVAMSRGAMVVFGIAVLVYLAVESGKTKGELFVLLLTAGAISAGAGVLAMMKLGEGEVLPVLLALIAGPAAFAVDWSVTGRLAKALRGHGKLLAAICGSLAIVLIGAVVAAFQITEPFVLGEGNYLNRGMEITPGTYTVSGEWTDDAEILFIVDCQTKEQVLLEQVERVYEGPLQGAEFTVPSGSVWTRFHFEGNNGEVLRVTLSDGTEIPMSYAFIPERFATRLQDGLLHGNSTQQRLQYMRDGMTLFKQSPLIGHGLGCTENLLIKVQPYHYESLFIHNHIIQVMDEMGAVGLVAFLLLLFGSLWLAIRGLRKEKDSLASVLIACWVMMNFHSFMEINFSVRMYQCAAFFVLMISVLRFTEPVQKKWSKPAGYAVLAIMCLHLAIFGSLLRAHRTVAQEAGRLNTTDATMFMNSIQGFAERAPFDKTTHQLNFVANALILDDPQYNDTMHAYVEDLYETGTYASYMGLAQHYYLTAKDWEEVFACSRLAVAQVPTAREAWDQQVEFYRDSVLPAMEASDMPVFVEGITYFEKALAQTNDRLWDGIALNAENQTFIQSVKDLSSSGCSDSELYQQLIAN